MPYKFTRERFGLYRRFWGEVSEEEFLESINLVQARPDFDEIRYSIIDLSDVDSIAITEWAFEWAGAMSFGAAKANPNISIALVTPSEVIAKLAPHFVSPYQLRIFTKLEDARRWIEERLS
ncbi:hypothetical protein LZ012_04255 [Dechloromonas sp. XY25]|uniref:STAS/SEC14 domain-containing protein n=1 Tax=Dechloromonas hankyongensis TaxID=2908002 RepID=A0ABS9JZD5_9RHOO|nr:STAS/SEC14 domain-containing protein [Dechloromonas hankyongensis]MCG2576204.1 hypothetical protein [Dechloromonas hankyongensis]